MPSLHHATLETAAADVERSLEFWDLLGFRRVEAPAEVAGYVYWAERDGSQIHLIVVPEPTVPSLGHVAVITPELHAVMSALGAAGFGVELTRELWGEPRAITTAPGGHRVELMAAPPPPAL